MGTGFTHFDGHGNAVMVNVGEKPDTCRVAVAMGQIIMQASTLNMIVNGSATKGDVLGVARIAAIQAAKKTSDLIPLCHPLALTSISIDFKADTNSASISCTASVETTGKTGVEMEALTAVTAGLLTIYDMCKAVDRGMTMNGIRLLKKTGGKSGPWESQ